MVEIAIYIQELDKIDVCNTSLLIILVQLRVKPSERPPITPLQLLTFSSILVKPRY